MAACLGTGPEPARAVAKRPIAVEDLLALRVPQDVQMSPDGRRVAYVLYEPPDATRDRQSATTAVWIAASDARTPAMRMTAPDATEWSPRWSPDSRTLALISVRDGPPRLCMRPAIGGLLRVVMRGDLEPFDIAWSPDGRQIAFLAQGPGPRDYGDYTDSASDERIVSRDAPVGLYVVNLRSGAVQRMSGPDLSVTSYAWSPDGKRFAVVAWPAADSRRAGGDGQDERPVVGLVDKPGAFHRLAALDAAATLLSWAPDQSSLAMLAKDVRSASKIMRTILRVPLDGSPVNLLEDYAGSVDWFAWLPDGRHIVFNGLEGLTSRPQLLDVERRTVRCIVPDATVAEAVSMDRNGTRLAFTNQAPGRPRDVWVSDMQGTMRPLTRLHRKIDNLVLPTAEVFRWTADDGQHLEGILLKPPNLRKGVRYATVVMPHGGSTGWQSWRNGFLTDVGQILAGSLGYLVFYPNPRGTPGYGRAFEQALAGDVGGREFRDVMNGVDALISQGLADPQRLGIGGWSWGGTLAAWAITQTDRFRCAIVGGGITNWESFYAQTDMPAAALVGLGGSPWQRAAVYRAHSPIAHLDRVSTPVLILHGADDPRVPVGQAWEIYRGLIGRGKDAELVIYPREQHFLLEPAHAANFMRRVIGWYEMHLKDEHTEPQAGGVRR